MLCRQVGAAFVAAIASSLASQPGDVVLSQMYKARANAFLPQQTECSSAF